MITRACTKMQSVTSAKNAVASLEELGASRKSCGGGATRATVSTGHEETSPLRKCAKAFTEHSKYI